MQLNCKTFWIQKSGNSVEEYEDAACPQDSVTISGCLEFRCAVADGATETSFAKLWANLLVAGYVDDEPVEHLRREWQDQIPKENLAWYVEEKAASGAFAAFVGLSVKADGTYVCESVGDSCLVHARKGEILLTFPLGSAIDFDNRPRLLSSKVDAPVDDEKIDLYGEWQSGDCFYLLTDAVAKWLLSRDYNANLAVLCAIDDKNSFDQFVEQERSAEGDDGRFRLHNDDATLMKLEIK